MTSGLEFDHLGLIVADLDVGQSFLRESLCVSNWTPVVHDPGLRVSVQFGRDASGGPTFELIAPLPGNIESPSPIANALRQGKHILNHVAYLVGDLELAGNRLREQGCSMAGPPQPAVAYNGRMVQFWISPLRFVIELIEKPGHRHQFALPYEDPAG